MVESLNAVRPHWRSVIENILSAKNNNQIRKIFREIKFFINEDIERARKIHLSYLIKVKLLLKSKRKQKVQRKNIILKIKNLTDDEFLKRLNINSHFFTPFIHHETDCVVSCEIRNFVEF